MAESQITNPLGAYKTTTDYTTGVTSDGELHSYGQRVYPFRANAAVAKGEVLMWVAPTTTVPLSVTPMTVAGADNLFAGVALEAAASGAAVNVCMDGVCLVDVAAETAAAGSLLTCPATTTGKAEIGTTFDATLVVGTIIGTALGAKDSNNLALAVIRHL